MRNVMELFQSGLLRRLVMKMGPSCSVQETLTLNTDIDTDIANMVDRETEQSSFLTSIVT